MLVSKKKLLFLSASYNMSKKKMSTSQLLLKKILNQLAGEVDPDTSLVEEYTILGKGIIMCYDPNSRSFKKIERGTAVYIIKENYDYMGRSLVYTISGEVLCIEPEELYILSDFN